MASSASLAKQNKFLPCTTKEQLLSIDYEIYSKVQHLVSMKIRQDLKFLERELRDTVEVAVGKLKNFQLYMESSTDQYRLFSDIVELIRELQQQNKHFCVNISNELIPAVYLIGGHRSFLLCVMESLTILSQVLEDIGNSQKKSTIKGDSSSISLRTSSNVVPFPEPCPETSAPIPKAETKGGTFRRHKRNASQDPRTTGANNDNRRPSIFSLFAST